MVFVSFLMWLVVFLLLNSKEFFIFGCILCRYFSQSVTYISSLDIFFHRTEVFSFKEVQLINYFFHELCLWCYIYKVITIPKSSVFSPMLFPRTLHFIFRPMIHFELVFVMGVRKVCVWIYFIFFLFIRMSSCSSTICGKDYPLSIQLPLLLCQRSFDYISVVLFLISLFCSIDLFVCSFASTLLSWLL